MKIRKNGKIVNLTESDLRRIVKRTLTEGEILVDGTDLKSGYGKIKEGLLKIVDIVAQSGEGMGRIESEVRNDINSAFSSLSFDKLIKLFTELGNEQFLKSFTNAIEFEDEYKEYITDKLGTLMRDMVNSVKSQKEKMASEGGEQKTEKIKENFISLSPCRSLTGEPGAECIMSQMVKNESLKIRKNGKVINLLNEEVKKIKHLFNFKKGDVITEDSGIDYEGITIGDITIREGDVYDMPFVRTKSPELIEIYLGLEDNIKDYESLFSDALEKCTWVNKDGETEKFSPNITLSFKKQGDSIFLESVKTRGMGNARCPYKCAPDEKEENECNNLIEPIFNSSFGLPKKTDELDPKFVSLFGQ
jgi:hypothetical protein